MQPVETLTNGAMVGKIYYDEDCCENPRENYDAFGVMICQHKRYSLGDEKKSKEFFSEHDIDDFTSWDEVEDCLIKNYDAEVILPLSLYDHSGISMSIGSCHGWDSGQVGFIYATKAKCIEEFGENFARDRIVKLLESEVDEYDKYLRGECYYFIVTEKKTREIRCPKCDELISTEEYDETVDSCSGFIGSEYVLQEVKSIMGIKD